MKAIAVIPGKADSVHLVELPMRHLEDVSDGRGVMLKSCIWPCHVAIPWQGRNLIGNTSGSRR